MITKASALMEAFIRSEAQQVSQQIMPHMPTLGNAYEMITKSAIDKAYVLPKNLDLHVVSGFLSIDGKICPGQIDCMLVHGDGDRYGKTDQYIYPIDKVICAFEVKKTLQKSDLADAMGHLGEIRRAYSTYFESQLMSGNFIPKLGQAREIFSQITGLAAPECYPEIHSLSRANGILFYALVQEENAPLTIIHGYGGYKTEHGLRKAFMDLLSQDIDERRAQLSVPSIPSLITSNEFCLMKSNGLPHTVIRQNSWVVLSSTRHNAVRMILEAIWSKLSSYFNICMPFDDDLRMDNIHPLLVAIPVDTDIGAGWNLRSLEAPEQHLKREDQETWMPVRIGASEISIVNLLAINGGYLNLNDGLRDYISSKYQTDLIEIVERLIATCEFMREGNAIRPVRNILSMLKLGSDEAYISSDRVRFDMWCDAMHHEKHYVTIILLN